MVELRSTHQAGPALCNIVGSEAGLHSHVNGADLLSAYPAVPPASEFATDGTKWEPLPPGISVHGSRYAVVLDDIKPVRLDLDLGKFEVGIGPSRGRNAAQYLRGRVDKGCLVAAEPTESTDSEADTGRPPLVIEIQAHVVHPYAVMLR